MVGHENGTVSLLSSVQVGDRIRNVREDGSIGFDTVGVFVARRGRTKFISISLESGHRLEVTPNHVIHRVGQNGKEGCCTPDTWTVARDVSVGDALFVESTAGQLVAERVMAINVEDTEGSYNAVLASCDDSQHNDKTILVNSIAGTSFAMVEPSDMSDAEAIKEEFDVVRDVWLQNRTSTVSGGATFSRLAGLSMDFTPTCTEQDGKCPDSALHNEPHLQIRVKYGHNVVRMISNGEMRCASEQVPNTRAVAGETPEILSLDEENIDEADAIHISRVQDDGSNMEHSLQVWIFGSLALGLASLVIGFVLFRRFKMQPATDTKEMIDSA